MLENTLPSNLAEKWGWDRDRPDPSANPDWPRAEMSHILNLAERSKLWGLRFVEEYREFMRLKLKKYSIYKKHYVVITKRRRLLAEDFRILQRGENL